MAERDVVRVILKNLRARGAYAIKVHGDGMQSVTVDILACYKGYFIGIEAKFDKNKPTPIQLHVLSEIKNAGGYSLVAYSWENVASVLEEIDARQR